MSRVGKNPVQVPAGVTVGLDGQTFSAKGKLGALAFTFTDEVDISQDAGAIWVKPRTDGLRARKLWGTTRAVIQNMVTGVAHGFTRKLEINGVGYRAQMKGKDLGLQLGYSHEVVYEVPDGIKIECPDQTHITITGADKQKVGQVAAEIRGFRPPEPYKGKGVKYQEETVLRKEGKKK